MLEIVVPAGEMWDEKLEMFIDNDQPKKLQLEHSLVSISKWESKWHKPFLTDGEKTIEETRDYIKCMTLTKNVDPDVYLFLSQENIRDVKAYIDDSMTASWFSGNEGKGKINGEQITSELIYYWMTVFHIPSEYQKWHLNRLITLIKICDIKSRPAKKVSIDETIRNYAELNAARKKKLNTTG